MRPLMFCIGKIMHNTHPVASDNIKKSVVGHNDLPNFKGFVKSKNGQIVMESQNQWGNQEKIKLKNTNFALENHIQKVVALLMITRKSFRKFLCEPCICSGNAKDETHYKLQKLSNYKQTFQIPFPQISIPLPKGLSRV